MNKILEQATVDINRAGQGGMSHCFFGNWSRRALLKSALPMKDWPRSFHGNEETMNLENEIS